jgi:WD40 repeat protein
VTAATDRAAVLEAFDGALRREAHVLDGHPDLAWQQLYNRLQWMHGAQGSTALEAILGSELERRRASGAAWLREITLRRESGALVRTLVGHAGAVASVAFSPNGRVVASGSADGTLTLWDAGTGIRLQAVEAHQGYPGFEEGPRLASLAFSPSGDRIVTTGWDKAIRLWDSGTLGLVWEEVHDDADGAFVSCAFSPDGETIAVTGSDIRILDAGDGALFIGVVGHEVSGAGAITACAFSPDGTRFLSGAWDSTLVVWDAEFWDRIVSLEAPDMPVNACAFSPDGRRIAAGDERGVVRVWDSTAADDPSLLVGHRGAVEACAFSPDGTTLVSAGRDDQSLILWDALTGEALATMQGHDGEILACAFAPDGRAVVSGGGGLDPTVRLWQVCPVPVSAPAEGHRNGVLCCAFSADGSLAVTGGADGSAHLWDGVTGEHRSVLDHQGDDGVAGCAFALGGTKVVTMSELGLGSFLLWLWDVEDHDLPDENMHEGVTGFSVSPDGERIASWDGNHLQIREAATGAAVGATGAIGVTCAVFTHDGERLVVGHESGHVGFVDPVTLLEVEGVEIAGAPVLSCDVSPDDRRIACGTENGLLGVWERGSRPTLLDSGDPRGVRACRFSPDGRWIAVGYGAETGIRIWDSTTGELVRHGPSESGRSRAFAFRPSSRDLVTARADASLVIWPVDAPEPAAVYFGGRFVDALAVSPDGSRVLCGHTGGAVMLLAIDGLRGAGPSVVEQARRA